MPPMQIPNGAPSTGCHLLQSRHQLRLPGNIACRGSHWQSPQIGTSCWATKVGHHVDRVPHVLAASQGKDKLSSKPCLTRMVSSSYLVPLEDDPFCEGVRQGFQPAPRISPRPLKARSECQKDQPCLLDGCDHPPSFSIACCEICGLHTTPI